MQPLVNLYRTMEKPWENGGFMMFYGIEWCFTSGICGYLGETSRSASDAAAMDSEGTASCL